MKIYVMSNYSGLADEGTKNIALNFSRELSKRHDIVHVNARRSIFTRSFWKDIRKFQPQIIHIILRPTISTLAMARALKMYCNNAKVIMSAIHPPVHYQFIKRWPRVFRIDLILTSTSETERMFTNLGWNVAFLPSGINTAKFTPVTKDVKDSLRDKYGVDRMKFIVMHAGPIRRNRNLNIFNDIQKQENIQVIIAGNVTTFKPHEEVYESLVSHGCIVWRSYFENMEEIYGLSDCYIFPVSDWSGAVELPGTVLEAMSCNLPVISTKFLGLPRVFEEGDGLYFVDRDEDFFPKLHQVKRNELEIRTRKKVLAFTWENTAQKLEDIYRELAGE